MAQIPGHDFGNTIRRGFIGEMAVPAEDALFQTPWTMRTILQHLHIVIGFEHEGVGLADPFQHQFGDVTQVCRKPNAASGGAQHKADWILRVMWNGKSLDTDIADIEAAARDEEPEIQVCALGAFDFLHSGAVAVNRNAGFLGDGCQSGNVITVLVCDEDGGEIFRDAPDPGEPLPDLATTEAHVHEQARFVRFDVRSVAIGAAAQDREFYCHRQTLKVTARSSNAFSVGFGGDRR